MNAAAKPERSSRRGRTAARPWLRLSLSVLVTAGVLVLVTRRVDAVPDDLSVPAWAIPTYLATLLLYFFARAGRWWFLVRPLGPVRFGGARDDLDGPVVHAAVLGVDLPARRLDDGGVHAGAVGVDLGSGF